MSSLSVLGVPWHTQILADQLTLFQPGGTDYAHLITTGTPGFSDLQRALHSHSDLGHVYRLIDTSYNLRRRKNYKPNENEEEDLDEVLRPVQPTVPTYSSLQVIVQ